MLKRLSLLCPAHLDIVPHHEFSVLSPLLTCLSVPSTAPVRSCSTLSPSSVSSVLSSPRMPKARLALGSATWSRHITSRWRSPSWRSATLTELPVWPGRQRVALSLVRISRDTAKCMTIYHYHSVFIWISDIISDLECTTPLAGAAELRREVWGSNEESRAPEPQRGGIQICGLQWWRNHLWGWVEKSSGSIQLMVDFIIIIIIIIQCFIIIK